jgi:hypothetical protein
MKLIINSVRKYYWVGILTVYPFWFMSPVLFSRNSTTITSYIDSDINGAYASARYLDQMTFPWSRNMLLNGSKGEWFWNLPQVSQAFNNLLVWLFTRFLPAFPSVGAFIIVGWAFTGIMVYLLILRVGASTHAALVGALACQMLPWMRERVLAHTSYVWLGIPLLAIYITLKYLDEVKVKNFIYVLIVLIVNAFFDIYWFWFTFWTVVLLCLLDLRRLKKDFEKCKTLFKSAIIGIPIIIIIFGITAYQAMNRIMSESNSSIRPLEIASRAAVDEYNGSVLRLLRPDYSHMIFPRLTGAIAPHDDINYVGASVFLLAIVGYVYGFIRSNRNITYLFVITIFLLLLSVPTNIKIWSFDIPTLVDAVRYVMPGVRRFTRATMISEALFCVSAGYGLSQLFRRFQFRSRTELILLTFLLMVLIIDLNPSSKRYINRDISNWRAVNAVLQESTNSVVYAPSPQLNKGYFPVHYMDASLAGDRADRFWESEYFLHAARGESDFASFLNSKGVTHLLVPLQHFQNGSLVYRWGSMSTIDINLHDERFIYRAEAKGERPVVLLEVNPNSSDMWCNSCSAYKMQWSHVREDFIKAISSVDSENDLVSEELSWSYAGEYPTFRIESITEREKKYEVTINFIPAFGPNAPPQILSIDNGGEIKVVRLVAGTQSQISIVANRSQDITIRPHMPCPIASTLEPTSSDSRSLCFGINSIKVHELFGG